MEKIKIYPKNKKHFIKTKNFCKQILKVLQELKITPILWGGLAYFAYTEDKSAVIHDIDLTIPYKGFAKVMKVFDEKGIKYRYNKKWKDIVVTKGKLVVDLDRTEDYHQGCRKFNTFDFGGLALKTVNLDDLIRQYRKAARVSHDKPEQHLKRLKRLMELK